MLRLTALMPLLHLIRSVTCFSLFCFVAIKLLMFLGSTDLTTMDLRVCAHAEAQQVNVESIWLCLDVYTI